MTSKYQYDEYVERAAARFESKYTKQHTGCWHWQAYKDSDGYGNFTLNRPGVKHTLRAHRISWVLSNKQDWPANKPVARHLCNNPCCVNPAHIVPGTPKENTLDAIAAGTHYNGTNARKRAVKTPVGTFDSGAAAAKALGIRHPALIALLKQPGSGYEYC